MGGVCCKPEEDGAAANGQEKAVADNSEFLSGQQAPVKPRDTYRNYPKASLELVFRDTNGSEKAFEFTRAPLGLGYKTGTTDRRNSDDNQPVVVTKVLEGSQAQSLGVKLGMRLIKIDGGDVEFESRSLVDLKIKSALERCLAVNPHFSTSKTGTLIA